MTRIIAMTGKGGTGKTTISALLIKYFLKKGSTPILAVDADSNINLNELLAMDVDLTIGKIRKDLKQEPPPNMTRDQYMEMMVHQSLVEATGFDLLAMGHPDGPGCYCAANQYLSMTIDRLGGNYKNILVDNEAGMEHMSRMNLRKIDVLLVISDPSARGILTAGRISDLTEPLGLDIGKKYLIINRAPDPVPPELTAKIEEAAAASDLPLAGILPASDELVTRELSGESYLELADDVPFVQKAFKVFDKVFA